ncbi:3-dehydroquinate dehydratase [Cryobacterium flavum]|uniref:3-dehydroquinate dehydratase n=1 Tax=Cryobacterium flavum TaxID=1424659 RepID=A0A4V3I8D5_9MICO|nr:MULTISPECIES: type II 3-dehydroquinate dehydratase [Cryobacterium]TFB74270.1 type II 3-dehydroquinate dehydratase [Cryobacterium flavum]SDO14174.1 3-dehydroquinate dehydratase [Cryobacterium flavum]
MTISDRPERPLVLVVNGPNLNLLGSREPAKYGTTSLADLEQRISGTAERVGVDVKFVQSNHEGVLIDAIHAMRQRAAGIIINAGAFTHTSVAIRDAISAVALPMVEVHLTNVHAREPFRRHSFLSDIAESVIVGAGPKGYDFALELLASRVAQVDAFHNTAGAVE